jgi:hypothetical protein
MGHLLELPDEILIGMARRGEKPPAPELFKAPAGVPMSELTDHQLS